jgi:hypothetical protein
MYRIDASPFLHESNGPGEIDIPFSVFFRPAG